MTLRSLLRSMRRCLPGLFRPTGRRSVSRIDAGPIVRFMGCDSTQYGSMERYLVRVAAAVAARGGSVMVAYDSAPRAAGFVDDLEAAGATLVVTGVPAGYSWGYFFACYSLLTKWKPGVVHAYFTPGCHVCLAAARLAGVPVRVRTSANMPLLTQSREHQESHVFRSALGVRTVMLSRLAQRILALTPAMRDEFIALGVDPRRVVVVPGGVDVEHFSPDSTGSGVAVRRELGVPDDHIAIGTVSRLVPVKNLSTWLRAAQRVCATRQDVTFVIVGDGPLRTELEALAAALGIAGRVVFAGQRLDAPAVFAALDIVGCPSQSEGLSNTVMEAMAMARIVVASDIPPNADVVDSGRTGYLVRADDPASLADGLLEAIASQQDWQAMAAQARQSIVSGHSVQARVELELATYAELCG